jgi:hypothetical protein
VPAAADDDGLSTTMAPTPAPAPGLFEYVYTVTGFGTEYVTTRYYTDYGRSYTYSYPDYTYTYRSGDYPFDSNVERTVVAVWAIAVG